MRKFAFLSEQGKVDTAVASVLQEPWMLGEIIVLSMFKNKYAIFAKKIAI